jgi:hypothetical protein
MNFRNLESYLQRLVGVDGGSSDDGKGYRSPTCAFWLEGDMRSPFAWAG